MQPPFDPFFFFFDFLKTTRLNNSFEELNEFLPGAPPPAGFGGAPAPPGHEGAPKGPGHIDRVWLYIMRSVCILLYILYTKQKYFATNKYKWKIAGLSREEVMSIIK